MLGVACVGLGLRMHRFIQRMQLGASVLACLFASMSKSRVAIDLNSREFTPYCTCTRHLMFAVLALQHCMWHTGSESAGPCIMHVAPKGERRAAHHACGTHGESAGPVHPCNAGSSIQACSCWPGPYGTLWYISVHSLPTHTVRALFHVIDRMVACP